MGQRKKPLAICDTSGMNGLANYMDEEEILTLEETVEEQRKKFAEVEHILQKLLEGTKQKERELAKSYAEKVKEKML